MMNDILLAYSKAKKVIESCENLLQIEVAKNYINLFFAQYSVETKKKWGGVAIRQADNVAVAMYEELKKSLKEREKTL